MSDTSMIDAEKQYLYAFVLESDFNSEVIRNQLRALWTTYCLHRGLDVDTSAYDKDLLRLWSKVEENFWGETLHDDYENFSNFMCAFLV